MISQGTSGCRNLGKLPQKRAFQTRSHSQDKAQSTTTQLQQQAKNNNNTINNNKSKNKPTNKQTEQINTQTNKQKKYSNANKQTNEKKQQKQATKSTQKLKTTQETFFKFYKKSTATVLENKKWQQEQIYKQQKFTLANCANKKIKQNANRLRMICSCEKKDVPESAKEKPASLQNHVSVAFAPPITSACLFAGRSKKNSFLP